MDDIKDLLGGSSSSEEGFYRNNSHVDLEQILREDDDSFQEEDSYNPTIPSERYNPPSFVPDSAPFVSSSPSHTAEDWAVLQAILQENDDDDDDIKSDAENHWMDTSLNRSSFLSTTAQNLLTVDSLIQTDEEDEEITNIISIPFVNPSRNNMSGRRSPSTFDEQPTTLQALPLPEEKKDVDLETAKLHYVPLTSVREEEWSNVRSERALGQARAYERKLLQSGHREIVSPLMVKRRLKPKIEMTARGKKKKSTAITERLTATQRFNIAGIVENKVMADISQNIQRHSQTVSPVPCGLPTCIGFNSKFIAIGTQHGIILVFDLFEVLRQRLGSKQHDDNFSPKKAGSVTCLDLSFNGDVIAAGYTSGIIVLWDTIKGVVLRNVADTHPSPISSVRLLFDLKLVTVDAGGLVNKLTFTKNIIWSNYSMETECLLDGTAGQILAMNVLAPFSTVNPNVRPDALAPVLRNLTLIALSSERSSFAVAVEPAVNVLHRWARPPPEKMDAIDTSLDLPLGQTYLPCLTWGWALVSGGHNIVMPILARAWGCCLQLLCASFPTLEDDNGHKEQVTHWPAFGLSEEIDTNAPVVALDWLNDRSLVYLTVTNEFTLVDTVMMTLLERLDFSGLKLVYAEFSLSRGAAATDNVGEEVGSATCSTFQNSIRNSDDRLMILCREEVRCVSIVSARRRISSLEADGEWLEALALALDHYESTVTSQEDRKRDLTGRKDLSRHPEFATAKSEEEEWIAKLLVRYINLAVDNAPEASLEVEEDLGSAVHAKIDLAQSHFQMLAGVCTEFCVVTRRLDLLFGPIFQRFQDVGYTSVFLDVLEPYVLCDKLPYISPEAMSFFVEHCKATNGVATVERCLLHMDCTIMDFDTILSLLRANEMYSALFYVFNQGLDDYTSPLEILLDRVFDEADGVHTTKRRRKDGLLESNFERYGYKAILYLQSCFRGKTFPHEKDLLPEERQQCVKLELMQFLMRESFIPSPHFRTGGKLIAAVGLRALAYPYMRLLLLIDPKALLDTISTAFETLDTAGVRSRSASGSLDEWVDGESREILHIPEKQDIVNVLSSIVLPDVCGLDSNTIRSPGPLNAFLDFTAKYAMDNAVQVDKSTTLLMIKRIADRFESSKEPGDRSQAQRQIMDLLSALPRDSYEPDEVLALIENAGIHRAALLLHQQVAASWHDDGSRDIELRSRHFRSAIDCYVEDEDPHFRVQVFDYAKKECSAIANSSAAKSDGPTSLRDSLFEKLTALVQLDPLMSARLVAELFVDDLDRVVEVLSASNDGIYLFMFLQAIISGDLAQVDPVAGSVLNLTMEHHHRYLALMAKLYPDMVYEYLSTHNNYRAEECLELCQQYDIADASAYLLERLGNVSSALQLILQTLESRLMHLKRTVRGMGVDIFRQHSTRRILHQNKKADTLSLELPGAQIKDVEQVKRILVVALDLCQRNSGANAARSEQGSQLWFNVLDRLINAKGFLRLNKEQPEHARVMSVVLSELLQLTMQRMVSSVPLSDLVRKVTTDHSGSRLGELREMVESLLGTYGFELKVFEGAVATFHQDGFSLQMAKRQLQLVAAPVHSVMNIPLELERSSEIRGQLRKSPLVDVALSVGNEGDADFVSIENVSYSKRVENNLVSALSRLRSRRGGPRKSTSKASGLNVMTTDDQLYQVGESEPVVYGERPVGALGDAEHRGRLVTFQ